MFGKTLSTGEGGGGVKWYADMHRFKFTSPNKINAISDNRITPNLTENYCIWQAHLYSLNFLHENDFLPNFWHIIKLCTFFFRYTSGNKKPTQQDVKFSFAVINESWEGKSRTSFFSAYFIMFVALHGFLKKNRILYYNICENNTQKTQCGHWTNCNVISGTDRSFLEQHEK